MYTNKIKSFLKSVGISDVDFTKDVIVCDDGDGIQYIDKWNLGIPKPSNAVLDSFGVEAQAQLDNAVLFRQIVGIEATVTNRRIREANITVEGKAWLETVDATIADLRAQLV